MFLSTYRRIANSHLAFPSAYEFVPASLPRSVLMSEVWDTLGVMRDAGYVIALPGITDCWIGSRCRLMRTESALCAVAYRLTEPPHYAVACMNGVDASRGGGLQEGDCSR